MANKKAVRFATTVNAGESKTLTRTIEKPATIEDLSVRFYQGPELDVHVTPEIVRDNGDGEPRPLVDLNGKDHIDGDGDLWQFDVSEAADRGDVIEVEIANVANADPELNLEYDVTVDMTLDRQWGVLRPIEGAVDWVRGVIS